MANIFFKWRYHYGLALAQKVLEASKWPETTAACLGIEVAWYRCSSVGDYR